MVVLAGCEQRNIHSLAAADFMVVLLNNPLLTLLFLTPPPRPLPLIIAPPSLLALSFYLGPHAGPLNDIFLNPQNPNLAPTQLLTSFPALPIRIISQSQIPSELELREQVETERAHRE